MSEQVRAKRTNGEATAGQPQYYRRHRREMVSPEKHLQSFPGHNDSHRFDYTGSSREKSRDCLLRGSCVEWDNEETAILCGATP